VSDFPAVKAVTAPAHIGRPGLVSYAISAVDTALWDLKATLFDGSSIRTAARRREVPGGMTGGAVRRRVLAAGLALSLGIRPHAILAV
jgi:hypothetical protein